MSPHAVNNFVTDLVEMAKAMEELPRVREELDRANTTIENYAKQIHSVQMDLEQSKSYAADLEQKVRNAEASRDDAEMRFLELDEKASKALGALGNIMANVNDAVKDLTPPKPEPVKEPEAIADKAADEVANKPYSWPALEPMPVSGWADPSPGQSVTVPTPHDAGGHPSDSSPNATTAPVEATATADPSEPYAGKRYKEVSGYIPHHEWIAGGGDDNDYWL